VRIGIDFDNTIVSYDALFHRVALEAALIPPDLSATKLSVREHLRQAGKEDAWTAMQGYVYGARMEEALAYPGAMDFFSWACAEGIGLAIVSHKTRYPFIGQRYDLHEAARGWVKKFLIERTAPLIDAGEVYFELTQEEKIARIAALELDIFIDDLPEIFLAAGFPERTSPLLFDPDGVFPVDERITALRSWAQIRQYVERLWMKPD
jgi:hypothetical protein